MLAADSGGQRVVAALGCLGAPRCAPARRRPGCPGSSWRSQLPARTAAGLDAAARDRLTGTFLDDYTQLIKTVVVPEAVGERITATATVPAVAVVSADATMRWCWPTSTRPWPSGRLPRTQTNSTVRVTMDNVDGRWLISGFDPI